MNPDDTLVRQPLGACEFDVLLVDRLADARASEPDHQRDLEQRQIEGRQVDLATDPPPDLILEIDISSPSSRRMDIYKQLGVLEIWRYSGGNVHMYRLQDGAYVSCDQSPSFLLMSPTIYQSILAAGRNPRRHHLHPNMASMGTAAGRLRT